MTISQPKDLTESMKCQIRDTMYNQLIQKGRPEKVAGCIANYVVNELIPLGIKHGIVDNLSVTWEENPLVPDDTPINITPSLFHPIRTTPYDPAEPLPSYVDMHEVKLPENMYRLNVSQVLNGK